MILEIAIGALTTVLGVVVGCMVLELAMRALKHSLRSASYDETGEQFQPAGSLAAWEGEQIPATLHTFVPRDQA